MSTDTRTYPRELLDPELVEVLDELWERERERQTLLANLEGVVGDSEDELG